MPLTYHVLIQPPQDAASGYSEYRAMGFLTLFFEENPAKKHEWTYHAEPTSEDSVERIFKKVVKSRHFTIGIPLGEAERIKDVFYTVHAENRPLPFAEVALRRYEAGKATGDGPEVLTLTCYQVKVVSWAQLSHGNVIAFNFEVKASASHERPK
jgi:hypothetical protein